MKKLCSTLSPQSCQQKLPKIDKYSMAKLNTQTLIIKVSALVRDNQPTAELIAPELVDTIESVIAELVGNSAIVEVTIE